MTGTIWKWVLRIADEQEIEVPKGTKLISAGWDPKTGTCVWGEVPRPNAPKVKILILIVGTGHRLPDLKGRFIGTAIMLDMGLVWHVYEVS